MLAYTISEYLRCCSGQGVLKVVGGLEIAFTLTSKGGDEGDSDELHTFRFSWLLLPGCFIGLFNIVGVIVGVGRAFGTMANIGSNEWGELCLPMQGARVNVTISSLAHVICSHDFGGDNISHEVAYVLAR